MKGQPTFAKGASTSERHETKECLLQALPVELLHQILVQLSAQHLLKLLQTSKGMAIVVMKCAAGKLTYKPELRRAVNLAGIVQQLQWTASACLKLMLDGTEGRAPGALSSYYNYKSDGKLVGDALVSSCTYQQCQGVRQTQSVLGVCVKFVGSILGLLRTTSNRPMNLPARLLPSVTEVCLKGFSLPDLVPADLAATCPNLRTVPLQGCDVDERLHYCSRSRCNGPRSSCYKELYTNASVGHQLCWYKQPTTSAGLLDSKLSLAQPAHYIRHLSCLKLLDSTSDMCIIDLFGPQLKELHTPQWRQIYLNPDKRSKMLEMLQKLVLPSILMPTAQDMEMLFHLPRLTHLKLGCWFELDKDYSSYPCKLQYLYLHTDTLYLNILAKLPLHSLTHTLALGRAQACKSDLSLCFPTAPHSLEVLGCLVQQLRKCGVDLISHSLAWVPHSWLGYLTPGAGVGPTQGVDIVPAFSLIAPAFGQCCNIKLKYTLIDQPILEAVVAVYGHSLKSLALSSCAFTADMTPAWHAALSALPALVSLNYIRQMAATKKC